jgi:hypothetical protein
MMEGVYTQLIINSQKSLDEAIARIRQEYANHPYQIVQIQDGRRITGKQFGALHLYCQHVADTLNDSGKDVRTVLDLMKAGVEIPWTKDTVKQQLYKPILKALTLKTSTTEQSTVEPTEVVEILSKFLIDRVGVPAPEWPSRGRD